MGSGNSGSIQSSSGIAGGRTTNAPSWSLNSSPLLPSSSGTPTSNPSCKKIDAAISAVSRPSNQATATARGSKKRSRASQRAPTTVLTTDISNFRQMVQEFTGVPTAPLLPRARFELFNPRAAALPAISGLLRPFDQNMSIPNLSFGLSSSSFPSRTSSSSSFPIGAVAPTAAGKPSTCSITAPTALLAKPGSTGIHQQPTEHASLTHQSHGLLQSQFPAYKSLFRPNPSQQSYNFLTAFRPSGDAGRVDDQHTIATAHPPTALFGSEFSRGGGSSISGYGGDDLSGWPGDGFGSGGGGRYPSINGCDNRSEDASSSHMGEGTVDSWICSSPD